MESLVSRPCRSQVWPQSSWDDVLVSRGRSLTSTIDRETPCPLSFKGGTGVDWDGEGGESRSEKRACSTSESSPPQELLQRLLQFCQLHLLVLLVLPRSLQRHLEVVHLLVLALIPVNSVVLPRVLLGLLVERDDVGRSDARKVAEEVASIGDDLLEVGERGRGSWMARGRGSKEEGEEGRRRASKEAQLARDGGRLREALVEASLKVGELSSSNPFTISFLLRAKGGSVRVRNSKREQGGDAHWRTSPRGSPTPCLQPGRRAHDSDSSQSSSLSQSIRGCCRGKLFGRARCSQRKGSSVCQLRTSWHPAPPPTDRQPFSAF